jgi:sugar/nucleoside kinase (ribokinase family)
MADGATPNLQVRAPFSAPNSVKSMKTLTAGHITHDHYEEGIVAGGCAFYGAKVHHALDFLSTSAGSTRTDDSTQLVTVVGEDFACDDALADLDATIHRASETTVFANYYPLGKPRIQLIEAQAPDVTPDMAPEGWLDADLVHLAPVMGELDLLEWKEAAGDGLLAVNIQGWIKVPGTMWDASQLEQDQRRGVTGQAHRVVQHVWDVSERDFQGVDIACLSEEDVIDQPGLLEKLISTVPIVAFTLGEKGSRIYVEGEPTPVGIYPTNTVDPTGAGDTFAASFCHQIAAGHEPVEAARFAAACASIVVEDIGARALDRLDEVGARVDGI